MSRRCWRVLTGVVPTSCGYPNPLTERSKTTGGPGMADGASAPRALVVIGGSAGGIEALRELVAGLPADLPAAVLVVVHIPPSGTSALPVILGRRGPLPAKHAEDGAELRAGEVLVAPPDQHLVVIDGRVGLTRGPQENGHRPAVDVLFRSAARSWGPRVVAVVLSGALDDGAAGTVAGTTRGGRGVVQSFEEALYDSMPRAAARVAGGQVAQVGAGEIGPLLAEWVEGLPTTQPDDAPTTMEREVELADLDPRAIHDQDRPGVPAGFG